MSDVVMVVLTGIALGFAVAVAAVPGAVNIECIRRGLAGGFRSATLTQGGALLGDMVWATLGLTGAALLIRFDPVEILLGLLGAGFLFALARDSFRSASAPHPEGTPRRRGSGGRSSSGSPSRWRTPSARRSGPGWAVGCSRRSATRRRAKSA